MDLKTLALEEVNHIVKEDTTGLTIEMYEDRVSAEKEVMILEEEIDLMMNVVVDAAGKLEDLEKFSTEDSSYDTMFAITMEGFGYTAEEVAKEDKKGMLSKVLAWIASVWETIKKKTAELYGKMKKFLGFSEKIIATKSEEVNEVLEGITDALKEAARLTELELEVETVNDETIITLRDTSSDPEGSFDLKDIKTAAETKPKAPAINPSKTKVKTLLKEVQKASPAIKNAVISDKKVTLSLKKSVVVTDHVAYRSIPSNMLKLGGLYAMYGQGYVCGPVKSNIFNGFAILSALSAIEISVKDKKIHTRPLLNIKNLPVDYIPELVNQKTAVFRNYNNDKVITIKNGEEVFTVAVSDMKEEQIKTLKRITDLEGYWNSIIRFEKEIEEAIPRAGMDVGDLKKLLINLNKVSKNYTKIVKDGVSDLDTLATL